MYTADRARLESALARAHRALFDAATAATGLGEWSTCEDLDQLQREVTRLANASLGGARGRRPLPGQQRLTT